MLENADCNSHCVSNKQTRYFEQNNFVFN